MIAGQEAKERQSDMDKAYIVLPLRVIAKRFRKHDGFKQVPRANGTENDVPARDQTAQVLAHVSNQGGKQKADHEQGGHTRQVVQFRHVSRLKLSEITE